MTTALLNQFAAFGALKTNAFGDRYLYNLNRGSFDKISAQALFDAEFKESLFNENTLYFVIGTDSGLLPKYIQQRGIPSGSRYIFIEPEEVMEQLNEHHLLDSSSPEIVFSLPKDWEEHARTFKIKEYSYLDAIRSFNAICAQQAVLDDYTELSWQQTEALQIMHYRYRMSIGSQLFLVRQLENVTENLIPVTVLANAFAGKTVIILAGGPSLTDVLPWLRKHRNKLVVFAVSRISRQLIDAEIEPDFVFSVDPLDVNIDVSREMFLFGENTIFIHSYHVQPALINQWHGKSLYLGTRLPWKTDFNIDNIHGSGPTVTNSALSIAHYFGFSKILLAGFDLCFTKEGITHAKGSDEQLAGPKYNTTSLQVETYNGEQRPTGQDYYTALLTLASQAQAIKADQREIINLAPSAAKVESISHLTTSEISLPDIESEDISKAKQRIPQLTDNLLKKHYQTVLDELEKAVFQTEGIAQLAQKALNINQSMYSSAGTIENYKDKRELDKIEKQLQKKYRHFSKVVKKFGVRNFIKIISPHDSDDWDAEKAQKIGDIYYQAYLSGANTLSTLIKTAIVRTKSREEELKTTPDFNILCKQWKQDQSFRRAELWLKKHPGINYSEQITTELQDMHEQFNRILVNQETAYKTEVAQHSTLALLKGKIKLLFKHKKIDELQNLKTGFINDSKFDNKEAYLLLIEGYLVELTDDIEMALSNYNSLINLEESPLLEEALARVASISLNQQNQQNALLAMDCLAQISPIYIPYLAELARILGDYMLSIDSYNAYISFFPEDTLIKLKLATLYIEIKAYESAELMIEHILVESPYLESAIGLKNQLIKMKQENLSAV